MRHVIIAACMICLSLQQALALSCAPPTIEQSFKYYSEAKEIYILVQGTLTDKRNVIPMQGRTDGQNASGESFIASFKGFQASRSGFDLPLDVSVAVKGSCLSVWCGSVTTEKPFIGFFEETAYGYTLTEGPCFGAVFYLPTKTLIDKALQCLRGGVCEAPF